MNSKLLFSFGLVSDIQYANTEDGSTWDGLVARHYRNSLAILEEASLWFKTKKEVIPLLMCIQLGDVLDAKAKNLGEEYESLKRFLDTTKLSELPWFLLSGNHDFYCFSREEIYSAFIPDSKRNVCSPMQLYYSLSPFTGYRMIFLDPYEISTLAPISEDAKAYAIQLLEEKNPNVSKPGVSWFQGVPKENQKFVPFNGGFSDSQIQWLRDTLEDVVRRNERCFIFSHCPVESRATYPSGLSWNNEKVLDVLRDTPKGYVAAFISGHNHEGAYYFDEGTGIHHLTPPSPLEVDVGDVAYGLVHVYEGSDSDCGYFELEWKGIKRPPCEYVWPVSPHRMLFSSTDYDKETSKSNTNTSVDHRESVQPVASRL